MKVKCIKLYLGEHEIGRAYADRFLDMLPPNPFQFDISAKCWYDDSFYGIENSTTFEARFQLVVENRYFCFSKPSLRLYACEVNE